MTVKEFIRAGYVTDVSIASKLIAGKLKMTDDIVKTHVTHMGAYERFLSELENTPEETNQSTEPDPVKEIQEIPEEVVKLTLTLNYSAGDIAVKSLPANKTIETEGHYEFVEEDLVAPTMTKKQLTALEGKEFVGYTHDGAEIKAGDSVDITEDTTVELIAVFA